MEEKTGRNMRIRNDNIEICTKENSSVLHLNLLLKHSGKFGNFNTLYKYAD